MSGSRPLQQRLFLPKKWADDAKRRVTRSVPVGVGRLESWRPNLGPSAFTESPGATAPTMRCAHILQPCVSAPPTTPPPARCDPNLVRTRPMGRRSPRPVAAGRVAQDAEPPTEYWFTNLPARTSMRASCTGAVVGRTPLGRGSGPVAPPVALRTLESPGGRSTTAARRRALRTSHRDYRNERSLRYGRRRRHSHTDFFARRHGAQQVCVRSRWSGAPESAGATSAFRISPFRVPPRSGMKVVHLSAISAR